MSLDRVDCGKTVGDRLKSLSQVWVWTGVFRHSGILSRTFSERALLQESRLVSLGSWAEAGTLTLVLGLNLFLYFFLLSLNLSLKGEGLLLKLVLLKL